LKKGKHILFVGLTGFPDQPEAPIQRCLHLGDALRREGWSVSFLNRLHYLPAGRQLNSTDFKFLNVFKPGKIYQNKVVARLLKPLSFLIEPLVILNLHRKFRIKVLFIYTQFFGVVVYYWLLSKIIGCKTCLSYVEFRSSIPSRKRKFQRVNDYFFDRFAFKFVDSVNPISVKLENRVRRFYPAKPQIRIPSICDFSKFENLPRVYDGDYFLYCGSAAYCEVILKIIDAFFQIGYKDLKLILVISGGSAALRKIRSFIGHSQRVIIENNIPYERLASLYCHALALLIPLRSTLQDAYRFPHKLSEYTASGKTIITTKAGEINLYFEDKVSAVIAADDSPAQLAAAMAWTAKNRDRSAVIGLNGRKVGEGVFSHLVYGKKLDSFFHTL